MMLTQMMRQRLVGVSADGHLMSYSTLDEVEDEDHRDDQVVHQMPLVVLLQMSSMVMSTSCLEVRVGQDVEDEVVKLSSVMPNRPMMTR